VDAISETGSAVRVLDYKMMDATRLRNKLKEAGEDVQLACYAHVYEAEAAAFISIEKDKVILVAPPQDVSGLAQANIARLNDVFAQLRAGAELPAHGVEEACQYCEMRGLCRKSEWSAGGDSKMQTPSGSPLCEHPLRGLPAYPTSGGEQIGSSPDKGRLGGV
jgi:ATP-dependent helicase/nuclease subunit B